MEEKKNKKTIPYFTRKNLLVIGLAALFSVLYIFVGLCLTAETNKIFAKDNPVLLFAKAMGFKSIVINGPIGMVGLVLIALYVLIFVIAIIYEFRYAKINKISKNDYRMWLTYIITFISCVLLSYGITMLLIAIFNSKDVALVSEFLGNTLVISILLYLAFAALIGAIVMLITNFVLVDKPFKMFNKSEADLLEDEEEEVDNNVTGSFDADVNSTSSVGSSNGVAAGIGASGAVASESSAVSSLDDRELVFPGLYSIDVKYDGYPIEKIETDDLSLEEIAAKFQNYLAKAEHLYYDIRVLRYFLAGFASTRLCILEGLSGTGKSSLPRYFAKFINAKVIFLPVQSTWRDKTSILGYFNDFSKTYTETDFLLALYEANYNPDMIHMFVLDEMNISRVEYYFADFLSVLEYPSSEWKLRILQLPHGFIPPAKLDNGNIQIPTNSYFVGTANKDDSTFSISDKVYDRAFTIFFDNRNDAISVKSDVETIKLSNSKLLELYKHAINTKANRLTKSDISRFSRITDFIYDTFDVTFGNRILNQMETIVPVYVSAGGKKEEALDFILSRKIIAKLDGRFEEYVKPSLKKLLELIHDVYGSDTLILSEKVINSLMRKL